MADLLRLNSIPGAGAMQKDKLGSPSTGSEDGGNGGAIGGGAVGLDVPAESTQDLAEQDEFDGPALPNGMLLFGVHMQFSCGRWQTRTKNMNTVSHGSLHASAMCWVYF